VHEVQVEVLQAEVLQGVLDGQLNVFGVVVQLEELGGDENLLPSDTRLLDALSDLSLVSVGPSAAGGISVAPSGLRWRPRDSLNVSVSVLSDQLRAKLYRKSILPTLRACSTALATSPLLLESAGTWYFANRLGI
jgi:hypothetical protein